MKPKKSTSQLAGASASRTPVPGSQTLWRGLNLLEVVALGPATLSELTRRLALNRSTVHRLAAALVDRGYMRLEPGQGYMLGGKLLELGYAARHQIDLPRIARPHLEQLSELSGDAVHLGVIDGDQALYLDKLPGKRRINISSRVGERHPLCRTGLGKALLLDLSPKEWRFYFRSEVEALGKTTLPLSRWLEQMSRYAKEGYTFDLEENEDRVRCIGAPIRDQSGAIVAAVSVSSVAQYMSEERMSELVVTVVDTAAAISAKLGYRDDDHQS
jgi:DNA-binding IclR family transcriptional regulator